MSDGFEALMISYRGPDGEMIRRVFAYDELIKLEGLEFFAVRLQVYPTDDFPKPSAEGTMGHGMASIARQ